MSREAKDHPFIPTLKSYLSEGRLDRREFLRQATLLGVSAGAAYAMAGKLTGEALVNPAAAQAAMPAGGRLRIAMRVFDVKSPHTLSATAGSNVCRQVVDYLTVTGRDNVTRPGLVETWEASPDLKTWTLKVRQNVKWTKGRDFTADDAIWNLKRVLDPKTGSSVLGLMKSYLLTEYDTGEKDAQGNVKKSTKLWDANAIEKVDSHTIRLNCATAQLAVPEHLFHYPFLILDPEENGEFKVGSNGTGAFELVDMEVGKRAVYKAKKGYWGGGPHVDTLEFIDLGDDSAAQLAAFASKQVDGVYLLSNELLPAVKGMAHAEVYAATTGQTGVARGHYDAKPFSDRRVRQALRCAVDAQKIVDVTLRETAEAAEHTHVGSMHPDYKRLPAIPRDVEKAKKLLADAGYPNGLDLEIACRKDPSWESQQVLALVEQWKDAGIRVKVNIMPTAEYNKVWISVPFGFIGWAHRPLGVINLGLAYRSGVPWNESHYANPEFDKLLSEAEGTLDIDKRRELVGKLQAIMQDDGPIVQPMWNKVHSAYDKKVKGASMHPSIYVFGHEMAVGA